MSFILLGILNAQAEAGVAGDYNLLETQILSSSASSVTFTGLGSYSDYKHLQIRAVARTDRGLDVDTVKMQFNSDTSSNYSTHGLLGNGSSVVSEAVANTNYIDATRTGGNADTDRFGAGVVDILDPFETTKYTTARALAGHAAASFPRVNLFSGLWRNTDALTSITLFPAAGTNLLTGSRFSLYGIKAA